MIATLAHKTHLVFGAGLIGCYLGGVMRSRGLNASLVCRPAVKAKLIRGMQLSDYLGHHQSLSYSELFAHEQLGLTACDFIWLTVKCTGIDQALLDIAAYVKVHTVIFCCQNGLGADALVKQAFPDNLVLRVMVPFNVVALQDGHFHRGSQGIFTIESNQNSHQLIQKLVDELNCELLPTTSCQQMSALLWAKLQLNLGNCVNALADMPVKSMLEQRAYRLVIASMMKELLLVTDKLGLVLPKVTALPAHWLPGLLALPNFLFKLIANKMLAIDPTVRTSMWWDVSQGKPTEIDYLNGAVVEQARRLNIACPANQLMVELIKTTGSSKQNAAQAHKPPMTASALLKLLQHA